MELDSLSEQGFVRTLGGVFEDSPWVAERAFAGRPYGSWEALQQSMIAIVAAASKQEQLALLRAHPDLGTRARVSENSAAEQRGAGLDQLTPGEFDALVQMNAEYKSKFGFPFVYAVKGANKNDILLALEARLASTPEAEFVTALEQVYRIAGFRLRELQR